MSLLIKLLLRRTLQRVDLYSAVTEFIYVIVNAHHAKENSLTDIAPCTQQ